MPYTVSASFDKFRENIELSGDHREMASARRDNIVSLLKNHFDILEAFPTGSIPRYTAVRKYADLDVMVALHYGRHIKGKTPSQVLQAARDALGEYRTNVRKNGQAVTLFYQSWPNVDIVPVARVTDNDTVLYYEVPDMNRGTWIPSKPKLHSRQLSERNDLCGDMFKRIIKMIKWWNHQHSDLMQSYHIEVIALRTFNIQLSDYSWDVFQFFKSAEELVKAPLAHEGSYADEYLDYESRTEVLKRLAAARDKARDAWYLTYPPHNSHKEAIEIWRQIFGSEFPAYGS